MADSLNRPCDPSWSFASPVRFSWQTGLVSGFSKPTCSVTTSQLSAVSVQLPPWIKLILTDCTPWLIVGRLEAFQQRADGVPLRGELPPETAERILVPENVFRCYVAVIIEEEAFLSGKSADGWVVSMPAQLGEHSRVDRLSLLRICEQVVHHLRHRGVRGDTKQVQKISSRLLDIARHIQEGALRQEKVVPSPGLDFSGAVPARLVLLCWQPGEFRQRLNPGRQGAPPVAYQGAEVPDDPSHPVARFAVGA